MLSVRCGRGLLAVSRTCLATPQVASLSNKNQIPEDNMFWLRHQIKAKANYHKQVNFERAIAFAALGSFVGCVAMPGTFALDTVCAATWIYHGYGGVDHMIGDYVSLFFPPGIVKAIQWAWMGFCIFLMACFTNLNLKVGEQSGVGHILRAFMAM